MENCFKITASVLFGASALFLVIQGTQFLEQVSYKKGHCLIHNVTYPQSIEDTSHLIECDCGKYCKSDAGTCIRMKGSLINDNKHQVFVSSTDADTPPDDCTFYERTCPNGENMADRIKKIKETQGKAMFYIELQNNKTHIPCYHRNEDDNLYLENPDKSHIFFISLGIVVVVSMCLCFACCKCGDRKDNKSKDESPIV